MAKRIFHATHFYVHTVQYFFAESSISEVLIIQTAGVKPSILILHNFQNGQY